MRNCCNTLPDQTAIAVIVLLRGLSGKTKFPDSVFLFNISQIGDDKAKGHWKAVISLYINIIVLI